ncbi:MAG TPA: glycoside hydrolase family 2 protein [Roseiflexaceae bacterium]|nr:glycoside hydrolase family 2 protein [Roseiflexaceae bacterium]
MSDGLLDTWRLGDFAPGEGVAQGAHRAEFDHSGWLEITAPGDVHQCLLAAGRIDDPFYDRNELACAWVEEREWWYRTTFEAPAAASDERLLLVFHGLDTFATVWLDGVELGRHRNMFRPAVFDVTARLRPGRVSTLALCFDRPLDHIGDIAGAAEFRSWGRNPERVFMRKAQFGYGWDWGPRLPTVGIWRPAELRRERRAALGGVHFRTLALGPGGDHALVAVSVEAERFATDRPLQALIRLTPANGDTPAAEQTLPLDGADTALAGTAYLRVERPQLWWTHDLGAPALYGLEVELRQGDDTLATERRAVGIRTLTLDQSPDTDEPGTRFFRFVLNGAPIFARGANWIPADSFVGGLTPERYRIPLETARDAQMNMLRVWGGGIYEHDTFYEQCDRLGLLVWQDFMFACAMYPEHDPGFVAEVEAEARYQLRRLRSHACLALWCGNNENQWIHDQRNWRTPDQPVPGALFYHRLLPALAAELDGQTPYWPGSPYGGDDYNSPDDGDAHNWRVWHGLQPHRFGQEQRTDQSPAGVSYRHYAEDRSRFVSEFGMHAAPVFETLRRAIPEGQRYHHSPSMDHHNKDNPKNKGDNLMQTVTGLPRDLEEYIDFSMIAQAEGLKFGIEHYRRRKPHCSGTLIWQLNDCWPVLSWSIVDYHGFGKAGYFYTKRVYAPVLASFLELPDGAVELWITNDTLGALADTATVFYGGFDGAPLWEEQIPIRTAANSSGPVARWSAEQVPASAARYLAVASQGGCFPANRLFFAAIKDLARTPVRPELRATTVDEHTLSMELRCAAYGYFVHLDVAHEATRFSDNYIDLLPGQTRTITVSNPAIPLTPDMLRLGWR